MLTWEIPCNYILGFSGFIGTGNNFSRQAIFLAPKVLSNRVRSIFLAFKMSSIRVRPIFLAPKVPSNWVGPIFLAPKVLPD